MASISALSQITLPAAPTASGQAATKAYADQGLRTVSSLASITSPVTGQLALLTTDLMIYRWTGSAWLGVSHTAASGGFARYERTTAQSIANTTLTKVAVTTAVSTHADVTANGSFDAFTVNRGGTWRMAGTVSYPGSSGGTGRALWIATATDSTRFDLVNAQPNAGWINGLHVTSTVHLDSGTQVALWTYHDNGAALSFDVAQCKPSFCLYWEGP